MKSFNLLEEPWIPCVWPDGTARELSLRDTLLQAHSIREIFDASPLVTAALHRLLLAVLWRNFPLRSLNEWKTLWQAQAYDAASLSAYFDQWHKRFDLLDTKRPFYQRAHLELGKRTPLKRLGWEFAAGNNATLFDHSWDDDRPPIAPALAARWVIASQCFAASAGKSETLHTKDSPWTRGAIILVQGNTLFETLSLNLLNLLKPDFPTTEVDLPAWETDAEMQPAHEQTPDGLSDYLTWQSRSIKLLLSERNTLRECFFAQGRALTDTFKNEPYYAYKRDEKNGLLVWQFNEGRALWRDSHALLNLTEKAPFQLPLAFTYLARLVREGTLTRQKLYRLQILGQCLESGQPTIHFWRNERWPLRVEYLNEKALLDKLREALQLSEDVARVLQSVTYQLAKNLLEFVAERQARKEDIRPVSNHLSPEAHYWSQLETPFKLLLAQLPNDQTIDADGEAAYGLNELPHWAETLRKTATEAFEQATRSLDSSSRTLKAVAIAERSFNAKLHELLKEHLPKTQTIGGQA